MAESQGNNQRRPDGRHDATDVADASNQSTEDAAAQAHGGGPEPAERAHHVDYAPGVGPTSDRGVGPADETDWPLDEEPDEDADGSEESPTERLRRRAAFLRDLAEARELRDRVSPRRTRVLRLRETRRRSTYHQSS